MFKPIVCMCGVVLFIIAGSVSAAPIFEDDFEAYPVSNPADFSATGNWTWNGVGVTGHDSRIFATGNYGGSQLWIAHPDAAGSGIISRGIDAEANTDYILTANIVVETFRGTRELEYSIDLLVGSEIDFASSIIGGPMSVIGRGDHDASIPGSIDDSYEDQITSIPFNTGIMELGDQLFVVITYANKVPDNLGGFAGVDNVNIDIPEPATMALMGLGGLAMLRRKR